MCGLELTPGLSDPDAALVKASAAEGGNGSGKIMSSWASVGSSELIVGWSVRWGVLCDLRWLVLGEAVPYVYYSGSKLDSLLVENSLPVTGSGGGCVVTFVVVVSVVAGSEGHEDSLAW